MKKINYIMGFVLGLLVFSSCESDRDSNPTLQKPTKFVLNTSPYVNGVYNLKETKTVLFTCSQPDYGFVAPVNYAVQVATKSDFSKFATLETTYTTARMDVSAFEIARAIVPLLGVETPEKFPTTEFPLYFRLKATIPGTSADTILSNVITLPKVRSYFALDPMKLPTDLYAIGDFAEWNWEKAFAMVPIHSNPDKFWGLLWCEAGKGMKFNTVTTWNGNQFGVGTNVTIKGIDYNTDNDKNIVFKTTGWRLVQAEVKIVGRSYQYTLSFFDPNIYVIGATNGGPTWGESSAWKFTVPTTRDGEFVSPALANPGELRMGVVFPDIDWWKTEFIILKGKIVYRAAGADQERVTVDAGKMVHLNILGGSGSVK